GIRDLIVTGVQTCALPIFGRFIGRTAMISSVVPYEGDPPGWGQGYAPAPADDSHAEAHRPDLQSAVPALSARPAEARAGDRRSQIGRASCRERVESEGGGG